MTTVTKQTNLNYIFGAFWEKHDFGHILGELNAVVFDVK
jgi:hypothetical protein